MVVLAGAVFMLGVAILGACSPTPSSSSVADAGCGSVDAGCAAGCVKVKIRRVDVSAKCTGPNEEVDCAAAGPTHATISCFIDKSGAYFLIMDYVPQSFGLRQCTDDETVIWNEAVRRPCEDGGVIP